MTTVLFYVSLLLSVLSFLVFALAVWTAFKAAAAADRAAGGAQNREIKSALPDPIKLAEAFAKAGPAATAAALSIFFMSVALVVSGVVQLSVETGTPAPAAAQDQANP